MKLYRDQSGQIIVFGAISLFLLVTSVALVFNIGQVVSTREEMQNAADAAARSAALTEANVVSTIAFLNDGMAYIYYNMLRYSTNVTVFGVLAELKDTGLTDQEVGVDNAVGKYNEAFLEAGKWIPQCTDWLKHISGMESAIAQAGPDLVKREMGRTAVENANVEYICLFPELRFKPEPGEYLRLDIDQIEPNNGWNITSNTGYMIEIRRLGPDHWTINNNSGVQIEVERVGPNHYILKTGSQTLDLERPSDTKVIAKVTGANPTNIECDFLAGIGWAINAVSTGTQVSYQPFRDGGFLLTANPGGTVGIKRGDDGKLQQWNGTSWVPVAGDKDEVTIGGKTIPIQQMNQVQLPGNSVLELPDTLHIGPLTFTIPDAVQIGNTGIQLRNDSVRITADVGPAHFVIDDMGAQPTLSVNGLGIPDADGKWRILNDRGSRHRLDWPNRADNFWVYEWYANASLLRDDSMQRFANHAVMDNNTEATGGSTPAWTEWLEPATGQFTGDRYQQKRGPVQKDADDLMRDINRKEARPYMTINVNSLARPYCLTDDFLKFGVNIAVWRDRTPAMLEGTNRGVLRFNIFENPQWGFFAVASARCAFLDNTEDPPRWRTTFDTSVQIDMWADDPTGLNLYEPVWTGMLVSTRESVISEHIDFIPPDTGTNYVWRGFAGGYNTWVGSSEGGATWYVVRPPDEYMQHVRSSDEVPAKFRNMTNRQGQVFDYTSPDLPEAIDH